MKIRHATRFAAGPIAVALLPIAAMAQKAPSATDLLTVVGNYLTGYADRLGAVGADEEFTQIDIGSGRMGTPRRVNCSVVWLGRSGGVLDGFRDVVALDRAPIRPKDDRLMALFQSPTTTSRSSAHEMTESAVAQYLDPNLHALDQAMLALDFLRPENQERSTYKVEGLKNLKGTQVAVLRFTEKKGQPLVQTPEKTPANGRLWIDPTDGTVRQTELMLAGDTYNQKVTVTYAANPATSLWLPVEMYIQSEVSGPGAADSSGRGAAGSYGGRQAFEGRVTYTNFRRVDVDLTKLR
ncbi:MAG TPA: hypothetical protein VGI12_06645 [Vicinamibacterales bacterium]|jgi:hypothetical protein